jgi:Protein of unknown function (DUF3768)
MSRHGGHYSTITFVALERISIALGRSQANVLKQIKNVRRRAAMDSKSGQIRILNDYLRKTFTGGRIVITASIAALGQQQKVRVLLAVRKFDEFDADNDPHHEHDVAFFEVEGERYFFKVDYYDLSTRFHSRDPADPERTCRVLTIGHHSDY